MVILRRSPITTAAIAKTTTTIHRATRGDRSLGVRGGFVFSLSLSQSQAPLLDLSTSPALPWRFPGSGASQHFLGTSQASLAIPWRFPTASRGARVPGTR